MREIKVRAEDNTLKVEITIPITRPLLSFTVQLDPEKFGCTTPEQKDKFFKDCQAVIDEVKAKEIAMENYHHGQTQSDLDWFDKGWEYYKKYPGTPRAPYLNVKWRDGFLAAQDYFESLEKSGRQKVNDIVRVINKMDQERSGLEEFPFKPGKTLGRVVKKVDGKEPADIKTCSKCGHTKFLKCCGVCDNCEDGWCTCPIP